jgi:predicted nucleic acid-binding protein
LRVVLDACVLYSALLRDLWMRLSLEEAIDARWTKLIHDEWTRNALKNHPGSQPEQWQHVVELMDRHAGNALVTGFEPLIPTLSLPDPDDRHVLAAAIHCHASAIITINLKDFPDSALRPFKIKAIHPDDFLLEVIDSQPESVLMALRKQRAQLKKPAMTSSEFLVAFSKHNLPRSGARLMEFISEI